MQAGRTLKRTKLQFATDVIELLFFCGPVDVLAAIAKDPREPARLQGAPPPVEAWNATALNNSYLSLTPWMRRQTNHFTIYYAGYAGY
jgi:hypothetical protein